MFDAPVAFYCPRIRGNLSGPHFDLFDKGFNHIHMLNTVVFLMSVRMPGLRGLAIWPVMFLILAGRTDRKPTYHTYRTHICPSG